MSREGDYHSRVRRLGVSRFVYWLTRLVLQAGGQPYFRLRRTGREHVPREGPVIFAANHRSFLDPFAIATLVRSPVYFVAKRELFRKRLQGWWLNSLGAFPVRRGMSDEDMIETATMLLERGDKVVIFPEGTRVRPGPLGAPKRGVGRLAVETGAPVVPVAIIGTENIRKGWRIRPHKVRILAGPVMRFDPTANVREVTELIWSRVSAQWAALGGPVADAEVLEPAP
jgi:1-acyl-sn-glycerol-3-phosphate acyltransferase